MTNAATGTRDFASQQPYELRPALYPSSADTLVGGLYWWRRA